MKDILILIGKERAYYLIASAFFGLAFVVALIQNVIRYGIHESYNPWISVLYLVCSFLLLFPFLPLFLHLEKQVIIQYTGKYWLISLLLLIGVIAVYYLFSSMLIHLTGMFEHYFDQRYARYYFGREAFLHILVLAATAVYVYTRYLPKGPRMISGMLGKKEINHPG